MSRILIVYYSFSNNTRNLAFEIANQTGGELRELVPINAYSFNYNSAAKEVRNQIGSDFCPKLKSGNEPIHNFDTIFLGSPNWFKSFAPQYYPS